MAGIDERVTEFLETWAKKKEREILDPEEARCVACGIVVTDGNFVLVDGDLLCLKCRGEERGNVKHDVGGIGI